MTVVRPTRWRFLQLLAFLVTGVGLLVAEQYGPSVGVEDPLVSAVGAVLVAYAAVGVVWEVALVVTGAIRSTLADNSTD